MRRAFAVLASLWVAGCGLSVTGEFGSSLQQTANGEGGASSLPSASTAQPDASKGDVDAPDASDSETDASTSDATTPIVYAVGELVGYDDDGNYVRIDTA